MQLSLPWKDRGGEVRQDRAGNTSAKKQLTGGIEYYGRITF